MTRIPMPSAYEAVKLIQAQRIVSLYANGRIEVVAAPEFPPDATVVINRIPLLNNQK